MVHCDGSTVEFTPTLTAVTGCKRRYVFVLLLNHFAFSSAECQFSGNVGSQEELSVRAAGSGPVIHPVAVPDCSPADQGDGPKG